MAIPRLMSNILTANDALWKVAYPTYKKDKGFFEYSDRGVDIALALVPTVQIG